MWRRLVPWGVILASSLALVAVSNAARANGRYPLANQLATDPRDPAHLALLATFGLVHTTDGQHWQWICEQAVGYVDDYEPAVTIGDDGAVIVGGSQGVSRSRDGCGWSSVAPAPQIEVFDLDRDRVKAGRIVAVGRAPMQTTSSLFESLDSGAMWTPLGNPLANGFIVETVALTPANSQRIYVAGRDTVAQQGALERSDDGGMHWTRLSIDLQGGTVAFLAAVDPTNADRVYVRAGDGSVDNLFVSEDGGMQWKSIFTAPGGLLGFALSPDGASVAVGGPDVGIHVASAADYMFNQMNVAGATCLTWTTAGLYACAKEAIDGFTVALSNDQGNSFEVLLSLPDITPLGCQAGTPTGDRCAAVWPSVATLIGADPGSIDAGAVPESGTEGGAPSEAGAAGRPPPESLRSSCLCRFGTTRTSRSFLPLALAAAGLACATRRRSRAARSRYCRAVTSSEPAGTEQLAASHRSLGWASARNEPAW
ncbi:MAG TPA: hypothetical protein VF881_16915 [Polyangiaceae bacterium]